MQGGTLSANFAVIGPADQLDIKGTLAVKGTRLANFNLGSQMTSVAKLAGINMSPNTDFENISADAHSNRRGSICKTFPSLRPISVTFRAPARSAPPMPSILKCTRS